MKNKIKPFNTFICGHKQLNKNLCINFPPNLFYAYDIYSDAIFIVLSETIDSFKFTIFIRYMNEILNNNNSLKYHPKFYSANKTIANSVEELDDISILLKDTSIKKNETDNIVERIRFLFAEYFIPKIEELLICRKGFIAKKEIHTKIYLSIIDFNFYNIKKRLKNKTTIDFLINNNNEKKMISFNTKRDYINILSSPSFEFNLNAKNITGIEKFNLYKDDHYFSVILSIHKNQILNIRKKTIEKLEKYKEKKLSRYHSEKNDEENIKELLDIFDKQLIISIDKEKRTKFIMNKLKILKKMGKWAEAITIFKEILGNFKKKNYGTEIDRVQFLLLYSTLLMNKMDHEEAIRQLKLSVIYSKKNSDNKCLFESYIQLAHINFNQKRAPVARGYFNKAKKLSIDLTDENKYLLLNLYNLEAIKYYEENRLRDSIKATKDYLRTAKELRNSDKIYHAYCNLAMLFNLSNDFNKALNYAEKQFVIAERENSKPKLIESYGNLGNIYNLLNNFKRARLFYKRELLLAKKIGATYRIIQALIGIINCDLEKKQLKNIEKYCLELIKMTTTKQNGCSEHLGIGYFFLGQIYFFKSKKNKQKKSIIYNLIMAKDIFTELKISDRLNDLQDFLNKYDIIL